MKYGLGFGCFKIIFCELKFVWLFLPIWQVLLAFFRLWGTKELIIFRETKIVRALFLNYLFIFIIFNLLFSSWGQEKKRPAMNYDKLSRSIR